MTRASLVRPRVLLLGLILALGAPVLSGCSNTHRLSRREAVAAKRVSELEQLQLKVMRFADEYTGGVSEPVDTFLAATENAQDRLRAQSWKVTQATAAYTIATGPNPITNALDMVVLATLSRMVVEDAWVTTRYGDRALPLQNAHRRIEQQARGLLSTVLTPAQLTQLDNVIAEWRARNPSINAVSYIHFGDLANSIGRPELDQGAASGSLFALLGLDPFSSIDPAVREISHTRQVAERATYYLQRAPNLIDMQVEALTYELATLPETKRVLTDVDHFGSAAASIQQLTDELPGIVARERQAAIQQFMDAIDVQSKPTLVLLANLRSTLTAGTATSGSLTETIRALDKFMSRFDAPKLAAASSAPAQRPFDIGEYTAAATQLTRAAEELQRLIATTDGAMPGLANAADRTAYTLQAVADHVLWRALMVGALLLLSSLVTALTYRGIVKRFP